MRNICDVGSQTCTTSFDTVVMSHALDMLNGGGRDSVFRVPDFGNFHNYSLHISLFFSFCTHIWHFRWYSLVPNCRWGPISETSRLSAPVDSTPVKIKASGDLPGRKFSQRGSPVKNSASPVLVKFHFDTLFLLFPGESGQKSSPAKISKSTGSLGRDVKAIHLIAFRFD